MTLKTYSSKKTNLSKNLKTVLFYLFFLSCYLVSSQTNELDKLNHDKVLYHIKKNTDSINYYIDKLKQSKNQCRVLFANLFEANNYYNDNNYEATVRILNAILAEIENNPKPKTFIYSDKMVGKTYSECINIIKLNVYRRFFFLKRNDKKISEAYDYLSLMQEIVDNLPEKDIYYLKNKISVIYSKANLKNTIGEFEESIKILKDLENEIQKIELDKNDVWYTNFLQKKMNIKTSIGGNYIRLGDENPLNKSDEEVKIFFDNAENYYNQSYEISKLIDSNSTYYLSGHYHSISEVSFFKKKYKTSISFTDRALKLYKKSNFPSGSYTLKSFCYSKLGQADSAIYYATKVINENKGLKKGYVQLYKTLAENYFKLNDTDSAYKYSQKTIKAIESQNSDKETASIKLKNKELSDIYLLNESIDKRKNLFKNNLIIVSVCFIIITLLIIFYSYRKRNALRLKVEEFKKELAQLKETKKTKKLSSNIDNNTATRILNELENIESSEIFLNKDFSLNILAKVLNTNTSYLSRIFNDHMQMTFKQYLIDLRIKTLVKNLDENPIMRKYSIEALAESIGYPNASSFTRIFKNYTGVSPSKYLKEKYTDSY